MRIALDGSKAGGPIDRLEPGHALGAGVVPAANARAWPTACWHLTCSRAGASDRCLAIDIHRTTRSPTTSERSGRSSKRLSRSGFKRYGLDEHLDRLADRHLPRRHLRTFEAVGYPKRSAARPVKRRRPPTAYPQIEFARKRGRRARWCSWCRRCSACIRSHRCTSSRSSRPRLPEWLAHPDPSNGSGSAERSSTCGFDRRPRRLGVLARDGRARPARGRRHGCTPTTWATNGEFDRLQLASTWIGAPGRLARAARIALGRIES